VPQSRSGPGGEEKNSQPLPGLEPPIIQPVAEPWAIQDPHAFLYDEYYTRAQTPSWRTTSCGLFGTAYSIYSQLPYSWFNKFHSGLSKCYFRHL